MMQNCPLDEARALENVLIAYAHAVDSMGDTRAITDLFVEDAIFDLSGINYPSLNGRAEIAGFFTNVFEAVAHQAHYLSNFAVTSYDGNSASVRAYVTGMAKYKAGGGIIVHGRYYFDMVRTAEGWKAARYSMDFLIPPEA